MANELDKVIAGFLPPETYMKGGITMEAAGVFHSHFYAAGRPGAAIAPTPGLNGAALTTYPGQIPWTNPGGGANSYLGKFEMAATVAASFLLCDRLWHNSGFTVTQTTQQVLASVAFPARDQDGSDDGNGVLVGIEVSTATTNAAAITAATLDYTNSAGVSGRTGTVIPTTGIPATAIAGTFIPFTLQAGDQGVRSIEGLTLVTSLVTGVIHLVAYRVLARVDVTVANTGNYVDYMGSGGVRLFDNTVPFVLQLPTITTATNLYGAMIVTQYVP